MAGENSTPTDRAIKAKMVCKETAGNSRAPIFPNIMLSKKSHTDRQGYKDKTVCQRSGSQFSSSYFSHHNVIDDSHNGVTQHCQNDRICQFKIVPELPCVFSEVHFLKIFCKGTYYNTDWHTY